MKTTRAQALSLFDLKLKNPDYLGATHDEIGTAFAARTHVTNWHWVYKKTFKFKTVQQLLRIQLLSNAKPTLFSFGAIHTNGLWRCTHVVVVIGVTDNSIEAVDPLARQPRRALTANVRFVNFENAPEAIGNSYQIDPTGEIAVLHW